MYFTAAHKIWLLVDIQFKVLLSIELKYTNNLFPINDSTSSHGTQADSARTSN